MGRTHADKVKLEVSKAASGLYRTVPSNGSQQNPSGRYGEGPDGATWKRQEAPVSAPTMRPLSDFIVTKGCATATRFSCKHSAVLSIIDLSSDDLGQFSMLLTLRQGDYISAGDWDRRTCKIVNCHDTH